MAEPAALQVELQISGMSCAMCVGHVTRALEAVPGVRRALVRLDAGRATVEVSGADLATLIEAVESEGYGAKAAP